MMNNKKLERIAMVITALLFVASVTMFVMCFVVQPTLSRSYEEIDIVEAIDVIQDASVEPVEAVEPEITKLIEVDETPVITPLAASEKPVEVFEMDIVEKIEEVKEEIVEPEVVVDPEEVELLAKVVYQEAGSDFCCDECRRMVADVVLNRVADERFPDTILEVLTQEKQYGRYHWTGVIWPERANLESEADAVERAYRIAEEVLSGQHSDLYGKGYIWQAEFIQGSDNVTCSCGENPIYFGR